MVWSSCGPKCSPFWPPPYRYRDLFFALLGTLAFLGDLGADLWMAASYVQAGDYYWGGLVFGLLVLSSLTTQLFSWAWYQSDPKELKQELPSNRTLLMLHVLHLGYLYRCLHVLKVGFRVCRMEAATEIQRGYAVFLSHDISLLRLFETFMESAPQLTLVLYIILYTSKAEIFQLLGISTSFLCIAWALLDYHQSLRCFLRDKHKLDPLSSIIYFFWNFLLLCPRILSLALFALLFPNYFFLHFLGVWFAMLLWVSLQGTDFMEHAGLEWLYRAVVAIILYFCWFNVSEGRTCYRSVIYYVFLTLDSSILIAAWLWNSITPSLDSRILTALLISLLCYLLGILLRITYYQKFHPTMRAPPLASYDEVDNGQPMTEGAVVLRQVAVNYRMSKLSQYYFVDALWEMKTGELGHENGGIRSTVV